MLAAIPFPSWLGPEIIPGVKLFRWYGLMYVIAFGVAYALFKWQTRNRLKEFDPDTAMSFFGWGISGLLIGARLFGTLVYDKSGLYWAKPWLIFWPFSEGCQFTGLMGMSYHGGVIGAILGAMIYSKIKKIDFIAWCDVIAAGVPFGYAFGRLGNFINGELYGRVTALPWGMIFPNAEPFSAKEPWVIPMAQKTGVSVASMVDKVNLPRHPSQLYEAIFEGLVLGLVLWFIVRKVKPFRGLMLGAYVFGYGFVRFFIEYFREPDAQLGYIINFTGKANLPITRFTSPWAFSMGQIFCFLMMLLSGIFIAVMARKAKAPLPVAADSAESRSKSGRKLRRMLR
jgi:phosphatidylglycerol---prolipoprotein diacylglyceryl transferase